MEPLNEKQRVVVMDSPLIFLTKEMVINDNECVLQTEQDPQLREGRLFVNRYIYDLLEEGKVLTIDTNGTIKLWEGQTQ